VTNDFLFSLTTIKITYEKFGIKFSSVFGYPKNFLSTLQKNILR